MWAVFLVVFCVLPTLSFAQTARPHLLTWVDNSTIETRQEIERQAGAGSYQPLANVGANITTFQDTQLIIGTQYTYRLRSCNTQGCSGYSNEASRTALAGTKPNAPGKPVLVQITASPNLVASWSFSEGIGTTATDSSPNRNVGTLNGPAWTTAGKIGSALSFDGGDWIVVADAPSLDVTTGVTLMAWVYPSVTPTNWSTIMMKQSATEFAYGLYAGGSGTNNRPRFLFDGGGVTRQVQGAAALPLNVWSHVAGTYDGTMLKLFVNGAQVSSVSYAGTIATSTLPLAIGRNLRWQEFFTGRIDEPRMFNRALTQAEIQAQMGQ